MAAAAARWRRPAWRWKWQLGGSTILAVAEARLEMWQQRGGGGSNNGVLAAAVCCRGGGKGGGEGWLHWSLAVVAMDGDDNRNGDCLSKKGVEQGNRRGGI